MSRRFMALLLHHIIAPAIKSTVLSMTVDMTDRDPDMMAAVVLVSNNI